MGLLWKDLKFGARALARMPGSAAIAVVVLAIGIGLCSFMFSVIYGVYFRGLDIPESDRVLMVWHTDLEQNETAQNVPIQDFVDWRARQTSFSGLMAQSGGTINISGIDGPRRFSGAFMTANAIDLIGVPPILGRAFVEGDDAPGAPPNVILGYDAWSNQFGADPSVIGRDVRVNGEPATILGVMPEGYEFPNNTEVWVPLRVDPLATARGRGPVFTVYGRLADGVTRDQAALEMSRLAQQLEEEFPEANEGLGARVETIIEANSEEMLDLVFGAMMFAVICVLLVACANVASLLLARAAMRTKEAGIRIAMGGSRFRVMLPFFAEAFVLAAAGAVLGIGIAYLSIQWFDGVTAPSRTGRPWFMQFALDGPIVAFVVMLTCVTAIIAGLVPAFQMSRTDVNAVLKDEVRGTSSRQVGRLSRLLVTAEVALSCALLVGAGLMTKSIVNLGQVDYPYETDALFTARVGVFAADYPDREARQQLWTDLQTELRALPQITNAALTTSLPQNGAGGRRIAIDGVSFEEPTDLPVANRVVVSTGFFETIGTPLTGGRDFIEQDDADSELVAIVNQPMVDRLFGGGNAIGRRFREGAADTLPLITVVGIVPDLHIQGAMPTGFPDYEPAGYYLPLRQNDASFLSIAAMPRGGDAMAITGDVRGAVRRVDGDLPIYDVFTEAEVIDRRIWFFGVFGTVFIVFGLSALFMASVGLYGVLSFAVSRRTQEMGIRMALGAGSRQVVGLVARQGAGQLGLGLAIGSALAFGVTRVIGFLMYDVDPRDPLVFVGVLSVIATVGMAAAVFPARRATSVDPVEALRSE